jgi:hypothetical protein
MTKLIRIFGQAAFREFNIFRFRGRPFATKRLKNMLDDSELRFGKRLEVAQELFARAHSGSILALADSAVTSCLPVRLGSLVI